MVSTHGEASPTASNALDHYHSHIKEQLTQDDYGRYVAIDPDSGEWSVSDSADVSVEDLRCKVDVQHPLVIVHPRIWIDKFGGWPLARS